MGISCNRLRFRRGLLVIQYGTARLPRPLRGLAMTNLGTCMVGGTASKFATANGAQGAPLQTQSVRAILTVAYTGCRCSAGSGMPLPYNGVYGRREYPEICSCQWRSLPVKGTPHP